MKFTTGLLSVVLAFGLSNAKSEQVFGSLPNFSDSELQALSNELSDVYDANAINSAAVAIIKNGKVMWTGYFGNQSKNTPTHDKTLFNVASITKVITTETILRLAAKNAISIDEAMHHYWVDPDLLKDDRHKRLTPELVLTHTTGLPNWRFFSDDNQLAFVNEPGTTYGYSGEGFEYLALFASKKLAQPFEHLVEEQLFKPLGIKHAAFSIDPDTFENIARPLDASGKFYGFYCRPNGWCRNEGSYSAADDLVISLNDYAKFLIAAMDGKGYSKQLLQQRNQVAVDKGSQNVVICNKVKKILCPDSQGYGLGWQVLDYKNFKAIGHGGSDWSEVSLSYFYTGSNDGLIIFLNAPTERGLSAMADSLTKLDPMSPWRNLYQRWSAKVTASKKD